MGLGVISVVVFLGCEQHLPNSNWQLAHESTRFNGKKKHDPLVGLVPCFERTRCFLSKASSPQFWSTSSAARCRAWLLLQGQWRTSRLAVLKKGQLIREGQVCSPHFIWTDCYELTCGQNGLTLDEGLVQAGFLVTLLPA